MSFDFCTHTPWIGLVEVRPREGNDLLQGAIGALVSVIALAQNAQEFLRSARAAANAMEFDVISIENVEPWVVRKSLDNPSQHLCELADTLTDDNRVAFGVFDSYDQE